MQDVDSLLCDRGRTTQVCQTLNSLRINQNACGSFPAIRQATGRRPRGFSLFMKIFRFKSFPFFFAVTSCFYLKHPLKRKETTEAKKPVFSICRFLSLFLSVE
ncbi:TPA: hypothetical protein HNN82_19125 [Escherichia coli]|nr:hypothetical protein [Escherichia coli]HAJ7032557.1 hypothetical protein [Escherichia coli]